MPEFDADDAGKERGARHRGFGTGSMDIPTTKAILEKSH
jgi:hypothetical protein